MTDKKTSAPIFNKDNYLWMMIGLAWQSVAVYLIVDPVLHLKIAWWWVVAGSYCLAWIAGFLAFWAPGGIGIRELVFMATMQAILPQAVRDQFPDKGALAGLLVLLGFLLRLWTVLGEMLLTSIAYAWDYKGAMQRPDAPGQILRVNGEEPPSGPTRAAPAPAPVRAAS